MFKNYQPNLITPDNIDSLIIKSGILDQDIGFSDDLKMNHNDWILAQKIIELLENIFGRYTIKKMISGNIFIDEVGIMFTSPPWNIYCNILKELNIELPHMVVPYWQQYSLDPQFITKFLLSSIFTPWEIDGRVSISGTPYETIMPFLKFPSNPQYSKIFYTYFTEILLNRFQYRSPYNLFENRDALSYSEYNNLAKILVDKMKIQIYRSYLWKFKVNDPNILYDFSYSDILRYQRLSLQCIYDVLFALDSKSASNERLKLYTFLQSEGREEIILDFSIGRSGKIFGEGYTLHDFEEFYKLELSREDYLSLFGKDWINMANSIPIWLDSRSFSKFQTSSGATTRYLPNKFFNANVESTIKIANFLKIIAKTYGKIRIYGFNLKSEGYLNEYKRKVYFPIHKNPSADINMPGNNIYYYEIDPDNFESFSLDHFRIFLGGLFADHQGFFIRTNGMNKGEFLFAFDLFGSLTLDDISIHPSDRGLRPSTPSNPIFFKDFSTYQKISEQWEEVIFYLKESKSFNTIHRFTNIDDWHNYLKVLIMLNEESSSFNQIGSI